MVVDILGLVHQGIPVPPFMEGLRAGTVLSIPQATNAVIRIRVVNEAGDAIPLAGSTLTLTVRDPTPCNGCATGETVAFKVTSTLLPLCGDNWAQFALVPATTKSLVAKRYMFAVKWTTATNEVYEVVPQSTFVLTEAP